MSHNKAKQGAFTSIYMVTMTELRKLIRASQKKIFALLEKKIAFFEINNFLRC